MKHKIRVGVLRGGPSHEYDISLLTGENVLNALENDLPTNYEKHDIHIDKQGIWLLNGNPTDPASISNQVDVIFNALHGNFGEDGKIQHIFEIHKVPFTGSGSVSSAMGMNKNTSKKIWKDNDIKTPLSRTISSKDIIDDMGRLKIELYETLILPVVVKPLSGGSSLGISIVRDYKQLPEALTKAAMYDEEVMLESYIKGIEATCGVIEHFRGEELYALPPVEIRPMSEFFDYDAKYNGKSQEIVPATFAEKYKHAIQELSKKIHKLMGLAHYSRSDFIIHPTRGIYAIEVNTLPGLTNESLLPKSLRAVGSNTSEFIDHVLQLALIKR